MPKRIYIHIGRPKVGSTSLQHFLWGARDALLEQGILYPQSAMHHKASHHLAFVLDPDSSEHQRSVKLDPEGTYRKILEEAEESDASTIVASSENLFLIEPKLVKPLIPRDWEAKIVCYVRRQDEVLASSYIQELKTGQIAKGTDIHEYARDGLRLSLLDYELVLDKWSVQFGKKNMIVRPFEAEHMRTTIAEDFLSVAGADTSVFDFTDTRLNSSPARDVLDFLSLINEAPGIQENQRFRLREPLLAASDWLGSEGQYDSAGILPKNLREEVMSHFAQSNAAVARNYLGRRDGLLFRNLEYHDPPEYQGLDLSRFAAMVATLFSFQQDSILKLQVQVNRLRRELLEEKNKER